MAKLTESQRREIYLLRKRGVPIWQIAIQFELSRNYIRRLEKGGRTRDERRKRNVAQRKARLVNYSFHPRIRELSLAKGIDPTELYNKLFQAQEGKCAICKKSNPLRRLHLDHCHKTNEFRGLLCWSCNTKLGWTEKWMPQIITYLRRYK